VTFAYSPEDRILSQTQGTTKTDYTYDALGRRYQDKVGSIVKTVRHYTNETDNPSWVTGTGTAAAQTDIFTTALASSLNATRKVNGTTTTTYLNIGNLHGDTITSLQLPSAGYVAGPNELNVFDEYGVQQALNPEDRPDGVSTQPNPSSLFILNYGSLGQPQRETTDTGIQFMGARGYNPITGQFLTPDPITGGNETPYNYPNDPTNRNDISGLIDHLGTAISIGWTVLEIGLIVALCTLTAGVGCVVGGLLISASISGVDAFFETERAGLRSADQTNFILMSVGLSLATKGIGSRMGKRLLARTGKPSARHRLPHKYDKVTSRAKLEIAGSAYQSAIQYPIKNQAPIASAY
jgi:RHS repeat-associated protein